jgi:hypothetical protein
VNAVARLVCLLIAVATFPACQSPDEKARSEFRNRLTQERPLTPAELRRLFDEIAPVIAGRPVKVKQGAVTRALDEEQRVAVLGMLTNPAAVYDSGLRIEGGSTWRGVKAGGTPVMSEVDATQTLWIDVETFVPKRYEFQYSMPGFGDYAYDLSFGP